MNSLDPEQTIFDVVEAARYLRVGPRIVRKLIKTKKIAAVIIDGRRMVRIHRDALDNFVRGGQA